MEEGVAVQSQVKLRPHLGLQRPLHPLVLRRCHSLDQGVRDLHTGKHVSPDTHADTHMHRRTHAHASNQKHPHANTETHTHTRMQIHRKTHTQTKDQRDVKQLTASSMCFLLNISAWLSLLSREPLVSAGYCLLRCREHMLSWAARSNSSINTSSIF